MSELLPTFAGTVTRAECILWEGPTNGRGYGRAWYNGRCEQAHRIAYMENVGPIDDGNVIMHTCDNKLCINPDHLKQGTQQDNVNDMIAKGRQSFGGERPMKGSTNGMARLTEVEVLEIKQLLREGYYQKDIAEMYDVSRQAITNINTGVRWGHLDV